MSTSSYSNNSSLSNSFFLRTLFSRFKSTSRCRGPGVIVLHHLLLPALRNLNLQMEETLTTGGIPPLRGGVPSQLKKRKRLNAVLDKISHRSSVTDSNGHRKRDTNTNNK
ncbi:unnamed protein product [Lepeophtheirus salmonis]|uniref:(salmon louse) hypothetical protein n=1 Tax=Lepeophtheirus salmonis TaxID=72036 RepID=A0A7R8CD11_LEPSM|nr:unnamed protein product [Lepeophtheirus salmonis]CAF2776380.1 unnamed protein product [Lepeophtheirus salmonis]